MTETNVRTFADNWTGTGAISLSGDDEKITLNPGGSMDSEIVETGAATVTLLLNVYRASDDVSLFYRHAATAEDCQVAGWVPYTVPFVALGYVQVRVEVSA